MKQLQAFEFELKHNWEEECFMSKSAGACRFVFNKALAIQIENYEAGNKYISYVSMAKQLTKWRNSAETPWLSDAPFQEHKKSPERTSVKNPDLIEASWIKAGECSVVNWRTNLSGTEECYSQYLLNIPAKNVPLAFILQKTTARHRPNSNVLVANTRIMPTLSAR